MKKYCKAYQLTDLRAFPGWSAGEQQNDLADDELVYLTDELTVIVSPVGRDKGKLIFSAVTPEWEEFCHTVLGFNIPADLAFAYAESAAPADSSEPAAPAEN